MPKFRSYYTAIHRFASFDTKKNLSLKYLVEMVESWRILLNAAPQDNITPGALGMLSKEKDKYVDQIPGRSKMYEMQK